MSNNQRNRIDLTDEQDKQVNDTSDKQVSRLGFTMLESRITPLVVIAIIAILIGLLLPAVNR